MEKLGDVLRHERYRCGFLLSEVAGRTDMDVPTLSRIENNHAMPMGEQLTQLSTIYELPKAVTDRLVSVEYGLKTAQKTRAVEGEQTVYKFTVRVPRGLANAFLAVLRAEEKSGKDWLLCVMRRKVQRAQKKTAGAGTPTIAKENID